MSGGRAVNRGVVETGEIVVVHGSWSWLGDGEAGRCPFLGRSVLSAYDHRPYLRGTIAPIGTSSMGLHGEMEAAGRR